MRAKATISVALLSFRVRSIRDVAGGAPGDP